MQGFHLKAIFRRMRALSRTIKRIILTIDPDAKIFDGEFTDEEFDMFENKEKALHDMSEGLDYMAEKLERLIQEYCNQNSSKNR